MSDKVLLHTCCAPCATYVNEALEKEGWEVVNIFYNPNIHPFDEYVHRYETLVSYLEREGKVLNVPFSYNPLEYFSLITQPENRCSQCYFLRLQKVAQWGKERGFKFFTTTLTISPYQNLPAIWEVGKQIGEKWDIEFLVRDFREGFHQSVARSKNLKLYRQNYCGCIFSKYEGTKRRLEKRLTGLKFS